MTLRELFKTYDKNPQSVDLYHWDYDEEYPSMVDVSMKMFTKDGLEHFKAILDMEVAQVKDDGVDWVSVGVKGNCPSFVEELAMCQSGHCPASTYEKWFVSKE